MSDLWPYILLGLLGAYHGLNPAMGWLFAVALGMQERSRRAVLRSLLPIAIGHEARSCSWRCSSSASAWWPTRTVLHVGAGIALIVFGIFRFVRPRAHFRWTKLRVNRRELGWWSFLMSTAHGAGLMVAPVLIGAGAAAEASPRPRRRARAGSDDLPAGGGLALLLHVGVDDARDGASSRSSSTRSSASRCCARRG